MTFRFLVSILLEVLFTLTQGQLEPNVVAASLLILLIGLFLRHGDCQLQLKLLLADRLRSNEFYISSCDWTIRFRPHWRCSVSISTRPVNRAIASETARCAGKSFFRFQSSSSFSCVGGSYSILVFQLKTATDCARFSPLRRSSSFNKMTICLAFSRT